MTEADLRSSLGCPRCGSPRTSGTMASNQTANVLEVHCHECGHVTITKNRGPAVWLEEPATGPGTETR